MIKRVEPRSISGWIRYSPDNAQHSVHPTGGTLRVFKQFAELGVDSGKMALSHPTHQRVTPTVSPLRHQ